jgi:hypothetical protein
MVRASFSKCTVSSRAFARGLRWWSLVAAHSDLHFPQQRRSALAVVPGTICWDWLQMRGMENPKGFGFYL